MNINQNRDLDVNDEFKCIQIVFNMFNRFNIFKDNVVGVLRLHGNNQTDTTNLSAEIGTLVVNLDESSSNDISEIKDSLKGIIYKEIHDSLNQLESFMAKSNDETFKYDMESIIKQNNLKSFEDSINEINVENFDPPKIVYMLSDIERTSRFLKFIVRNNSHFFDSYIQKNDITVPDDISEKIHHEAIEKYKESHELIQMYTGQLRHLPEKMEKQTEYLLNKSKEYHVVNPKLSCEYAKMARENSELIIGLYENKSVLAELKSGRI